MPPLWLLCKSLVSPIFRPFLGTDLQLGTLTSLTGTQTSSKLLLTDNNFQSYQSSTNKKDIKLIIIGIRLRRLVIIVS